MGDLMSLEPILVTGSMGFLGRAVVKRLSGLHVIETLRTHPARPCDLVHPELVCDLRDFASVSRLFEIHKPKAVVNCAALCGGLAFAMSDPATLWHDNLVIQANLFRAASHVGTVRRFVNPISNCVYPGKASVFRERELWDGPLHPSVLAYGFARKAAIVGAECYRQQYGLDVISIVLPNGYGIGDHFTPDRSHALGALIAKFLKAKDCGDRSVTVWGTGNPVREWMYVSDMAEAMVRGLEAPSHPGPVNVGTGNGISIGMLAEVIAGEVGYQGEIHFDHTKPDGAAMKTMDGTLGREVLGWAPTVSLDVGIRRTVEWVREHPEVLG